MKRYRLVEAKHSKSRKPNTILESSLDFQVTQLLLESDSATMKAVDDEVGKIHVDWNKVSKILGSEVPNNIKKKFEEIVNGESFALSKFFKVLAIVSASIAGVGSILRAYMADILTSKLHNMEYIHKSTNYFNPDAARSALDSMRSIRGDMQTPAAFGRFGACMFWTGLIIAVISILKCFIHGKSAEAEAVASKVNTSDKVTKSKLMTAKNDLKDIWEAVKSSEDGGGRMKSTIVVCIIIIMCASWISYIFDSILHPFF